MTKNNSMNTIKQILPEGPHTDQAAAILDPYISRLWIIGDAFFCRLLNLPVPERTDIVFSNEEFEASEALKIEESLKDNPAVNLIFGAPSNFLVGARFVGDGIAIHLGSERSIITPEFWTLPPYSYLGEDPATLGPEIAQQLQQRHLLFQKLHKQMIKQQATDIVDEVVGATAGPAEAVPGAPAAEAIDVEVQPHQTHGLGSEDKK